MEVILRFINGGVVGIEDSEDLREALDGVRPETLPIFMEQECRKFKSKKPKKN